MQIEQVVGGWITCFSSGLKYVNNGIIFSGMDKEEVGQKNHKYLYGIRYKKKIVGEGMKKHS